MQPTRRAFLQTAAVSAFAAQDRRQTRPNILFLFPDQLRFDWTGANKSLPVRTPHLDQLAARGVRFTNAIVASPLCAPSRACLAAGKEYDRCGVPSNGQDYPLDQKTYYTLLRDSGYHVMGCGKLDLAKASHDWGVDGKKHLADWGFSDGVNNAGKFDAIRNSYPEPQDPYMAYLKGKDFADIHVEDFRKRAKEGYQATYPTPLSDEAYCDNWLSERGLDLLRAAPKGKPWHLVVNFTGPHNPMDITRRMEKTCRGRNFPQPNGSSEYTPDTHVAIRQNYTAMVENIDRSVGLYIEEVKRRGELDNTLIVFSSDHGEMLGDHDRWGKSLPWQPSIGVPLIAAGPGVAHGLVSDALVTIMDLAATYLDYAGIPKPTDMDSRSLRPVLEKRSVGHRAYVLSGLGKWRTVYDGQFKLIRGFDPSARGKEGTLGSPDAAPLLFNLSEDPLENNDLSEKYAEKVKRLSAILAS